MNRQDDLQLGFVLHARPWRETSLIIDVFTEKQGKIALCAKGVRSKKSPKSSLLQPLSPLYLSWVGKGELPTLTMAEPAAPAIKLSAESLYSAFYINELIVRLLHRHDPHPNLFVHYDAALKQLSEPSPLEQTLREFEFHLLSSIGYGLSFSSDIDGEEILDTKTYYLHGDGLFQSIVNLDSVDKQRIFDGVNLLSIAENNWQNSAVLKDAKRLSRLSFKPLLGTKPLQSRKLFRRKPS